MSYLGFRFLLYRKLAGSDLTKKRPIPGGIGLGLETSCLVNIQGNHVGVFKATAEVDSTFNVNGYV